MFRTIVGLGGQASAGGKSSDSGTRGVLEDLLERLPEDFVTIDIQLRAEPLLEDPNQAPYVLVAMQECQRMNRLLQEVRRTLIELRKGFDGQLNMSEAMEDLQSALSINEVPGRNVFHKTSWEVVRVLPCLWLDWSMRFRVDGVLVGFPPLLFPRCSPLTKQDKMPVVHPAHTHPTGSQPVPCLRWLYIRFGVPLVVCYHLFCVLRES